MVKPKIYLLITIIIFVIIVIKVQYYFKTIEEFSKYGLTCNQCGVCPEGQGRVNCGGTNTGRCSACTGQTYNSDNNNGECIAVPDHATTSDNINWSCGPGYYKSGNKCNKCRPCGAGTQIQNCSGTSSGDCELCPSNQYKPESGYGRCITLKWGKIPTENRKDWRCQDGYFYNGANWCSPCTGIPCKPGEERVRCGQSPEWYMGWCSECRSGTFKDTDSGDACTPVPAHSQPTWNKQGWNCNDGYLKSGNSCIAV